MTDSPEACERHAMLQRLEAGQTRLCDAISVLKQEVVNVRQEQHETTAELRAQGDRIVLVEGESAPKSWWPRIRLAGVIVASFWGVSLPILGFVWAIGYDNLIDRAKDDLGITSQSKAAADRRDVVDARWDDLYVRLDGFEGMLNHFTIQADEITRSVAESTGRDSVIRVWLGSATEPVTIDDMIVSLAFSAEINPGFEECEFERASVVLEPERGGATIVKPLSARRIRVEEDEYTISINVPPMFLRGRITADLETVARCDGRSVTDTDTITTFRVRGPDEIRRPPPPAK